MSTQSDASPFPSNQGNRKQQGPSQNNTSNFRSQAQQGYQGPTKYVKSTFNIENCQVNNAVIGNKGPVELHHKTNRYKKGSEKTDYNISGGEFTQSVVGGDGEFHNDSSTVSSGSGLLLDPSKVVDIDKYSPPFCPESYVIKILQSGISSEELTALLEKKYSVMQLAYSLPKSGGRRRKIMVDAMLQAADIDVMET